MLQGEELSPLSMADLSSSQYQTTTAPMAITVSISRVVNMALICGIKLEFRIDPA